MKSQLPFLSSRLIVVKTKNFSSVNEIPFICCSLAVCLHLQLLEDHVQNTLIEDLVVLAQRTVQDIEVGEGAGDVKEDVKELLAQCPLRGKDTPQNLEASEEAFDEDAFRSELLGIVVADDNRGNISVCPTIPKVREDGSSAEDVVEGLGMVPQNRHIVDGPGVRLGDKSSRPTARIHAHLLLQSVNGVLAAEEDFGILKRLFGTPDLAHGAVDDQGWVWGVVDGLVEEAHCPSNKVCAEQLRDHLRSPDQVLSRLDLLFHEEFYNADALGDVDQEEEELLAV